MEIPGYTIINELGRGGMATVYLAIQQSLDRKVALKVMSPALLADESFGSRFLREAKIVAKLSHPNVIPIYDVGTHEDYYYIAMEYESGGELKQRIKDGLSLQEAVSITIQIASALQFAHSNGYIHRDVKPDNILFNAHDKALLTDFGVARAYDSSTKITAVGAVLGTPLYMSPEQVQGKSIDHRADLYSLGAVFYEMLMGHPPFRGDSAVTVAVKHMTDPVPLLPEKYAKLQPFFDKLLNKNADQRFQTGAEIISELERTDLNNVGVSLVDDLAGNKTVVTNNNAVAKTTSATDRAVVITEEDHDAPTIVRSEPIPSGPFPSKQMPKAVAPSRAAKSSIPIVLTSIVLLGVLIVVGVLYFNQQQPQQIPVAQIPPEAAPQHAPSTEDRPQVTAQTPNNDSAAALDDNHQHIAALIRQAKQDEVDNHLTLPLGNNAYEKYLEVLKLDAGNSEADAGLLAMSRHFLGQIDQVLQEKQFEQATNFYDLAQRVYPKNPDLEKYQASIRQAVSQHEEQQKQLAAEQKRRQQALEKQRQQAEQQRLAEERKRAEQERLAREKQEQEQLAALKAQQEEKARQAALEKQKQEQQRRLEEQQAEIRIMTVTASTLLTQNNLTVSAIDQAYKIYNKDIRAIDPQSPAIRRGVAAVVSAYGDLARKELDDKNYDTAETIVQKGLTIDSGNAGLLKIQETIKQSKSKGPSVFGGF